MNSEFSPFRNPSEFEVQETVLRQQFYALRDRAPVDKASIEETLTSTRISYEQEFTSQPIATPLLGKNINVCLNWQRRFHVVSKEADEHGEVLIAGNGRVGIHIIDSLAEDCHAVSLLKRPVYVFASFRGTSWLMDPARVDCPDRKIAEHIYNPEGTPPSEQDISSQQDFLQILGKISLPGNVV